MLVYHIFDRNSSKNRAKIRPAVDKPLWHLNTKTQKAQKTQKHESIHPVKPRWKQGPILNGVQNTAVWQGKNKNNLFRLSLVAESSGVEPHSSQDEPTTYQIVSLTVGSYSPYEGSAAKQNYIIFIENKTSPKGSFVDSLTNAFTIW